MSFNNCFRKSALKDGIKRSVNLSLEASKTPVVMIGGRIRTALDKCLPSKKLLDCPVQLP